MQSFDVVSRVNQQEVRNAVDQANRELGTRFDFKGTNAKFDLEDDQITMRAPNEFQLRQMYDVLTKRLVGRQVDIRCLTLDDPQINVSGARQLIMVRQGVESEIAREIVKLIKALKLKVQVAIQGNQLRVSGKKRDDLQQVIGMLKEAKFDLPLQFENYRDYDVFLPDGGRSKGRTSVIATGQQRDCNATATRLAPLCHVDPSAWPRVSNPACDSRWCQPSMGRRRLPVNGTTGGAVICGSYSMAEFGAWARVSCESYRSVSTRLGHKTYEERSCSWQHISATADRSEWCLLTLVSHAVVAATRYQVT